jgi:predicted transcriptional regulator YdeE
MHCDAFFVIGIEVRTSNEKEMGPGGNIPQMWQKFFQNSVARTIPGNISPNIYAVYTDYASDRNGEYSFVIGMKVDHGTRPATGMVLKEIPAGEYACATTDLGPASKVVPEAWGRLWLLEDKAQLGGTRAYRADYEVYDERSADPQNSEIDIFLGLK